MAASCQLSNRIYELEVPGYEYIGSLGLHNTKMDTKLWILGPRMQQFGDETSNTGVALKKKKKELERDKTLETFDWKNC